MSGRTVGAFVVGMAAVLAVAGPARAAKPRIAVIGLSMGDVTAEVRVKINAAVAGGLGASGADVVDSAATGRAMAERGMIACDTATCLTEIGRATGAAYLMRGAMEMTGRSYIIRLEMIDASTATVVDSREDRCEICTENEAYETASVSASALKAQVFKWRAPVARAPQVTGAAPVPGGDDTALVGLTTAPDGTPINRPLPPRRSRAVLWTAAGVAAASIAVGVTLIAIDGRGTCTPREPEDQCKELYRTQAGGLALTGLGLVAAVAGALVYTGRF
jgi:hypothetical protein